MVGAEAALAVLHDPAMAVMVDNGNDAIYPCSTDFISELPDEILCSIIMHVTITEAVRTSILSHRWKKIWCSLPMFRRDWEKMFQAPFLPLCDPRNHKTSSSSSDDSDHKASGDSEYCSDLSKAMLIRMSCLFLDFSERAPRVGRKLSLCLRFGQEYSQATDLWVFLALRKTDVHELELVSSCEECGGMPKNIELRGANYPVYPEDCGSHRFHRTPIIQSLGFFGFTLGPNFFTYNNLGSLECLTLCNVQLLQSLDVVLPTLPNLLSLQMARCGFVEQILDLRSLRFLGTFNLWMCHGVQKILLAPSRTHQKLLFRCISSQLISFDLSGHPNVYGLICRVDGQGLRYVLESAPTDHPVFLSRLGIFCTDHNWVRMIPAESIATFHEVELLQLWFTNCSEFDNLKIISLLKAFPVLRKFMLTTDDFGETDQGAGSLQHIDYFPTHLQTVNIGGYIGPAHVEFAAFLLKRAANLKQLFLDKILLDTRFYFYERMPWDEEQRLKILTHLQGLSEAEILITRSMERVYRFQPETV